MKQSVWNDVKSHTCEIHELYSPSALLLLLALLLSSCGLRYLRHKEPLNVVQYLKVTNAVLLVHLNARTDILQLELLKQEEGDRSPTIVQTLHIMLYHMKCMYAWLY